MKTLYKYGLIFLGFLILGSTAAIAQEEEEFRKLRELRQLEKGYVEVDEIEPLLLHEMPELGFMVRAGYNGNSSMRLSKKMEDLSISKRFTFNVEEDYSDIYFRIIGQVKEGSLKIKLFKPDQKVLKELRIIPGQDQNWQQSFCLMELEDPGFTGKWSVELSCSEATGYYQFQFRSR